MPLRRSIPAARRGAPPLRAALLSLFVLSSGASAQAPNEAAVRHVLNRLAHGPTPATLDEISGSGIESWIQQQLAVTQGHPNPSLDDLIAELDWLPVFNDQKGINNPHPYTLPELSRLQLAYALYSRNQLTEQMTDFWETHFNVGYQFVWRYWVNRFEEPQSDAQQIGIYFSWLENQDFRENALGMYEDLLTLSANGPGMLVYLDAGRSSSNNPNENYSRELLELYTLGEGNFAQSDVLEGAKLFTGVEIERVPPAQYGNPLTNRVTADDAYSLGDLDFDGLVTSDDQATVQDNMFTSGPEGDVNKDGTVNLIDFGIVSGNLGLTTWVYGPWFNENDYVVGPKTFYLGSPNVSFTITPSGSPTRAEKFEETLDYLQHLASHPGTASYVSAKLMASFVAPVDPDSDVATWPSELALLHGECVTTWLQTGGDVREVLRTLFASPVFLEDTSYFGSLTETAFESVVSTVRMVEIDYLNKPMVRTRGQLDEMRYSVEIEARQRLFEYPAPDGYHPSPPGSANLLARMRFHETAFDEEVITPDWPLLLPGTYPNYKALAMAALGHFYGPSGFSMPEAFQAAGHLSDLNAQGISSHSDLLQALAAFIASYPQSFRK